MWSNCGQIAVFSTFIAPQPTNSTGLRLPRYRNRSKWLFSSGVLQLIGCQLGSEPTIEFRVACRRPETRNGMECNAACRHPQTPNKLSSIFDEIAPGSRTFAEDRDEYWGELGLGVAASARHLLPSLHHPMGQYPGRIPGQFHAAFQAQNNC